MIYIFPEGGSFMAHKLARLEELESMRIMALWQPQWRGSGRREINSLMRLSKKMDAKKALNQFSS